MTGARSRWRSSRGWRQAVKRTLDVAGSGVGLIILGPVLAAVALAVVISTGRPALFRQTRSGRDGTPFELLKFRSMTDVRDQSGVLLTDRDRITPVGRFLRSWALDELPQLLNVLRGEMSLVGPRPLPPEYLDHYTPEQARRHNVLPGITGWAQVNGRNSLRWRERFELDLWYVDHWSLRLDLRILARTPSCVASRIGLSAPGHATMPRFDADPSLAEATEQPT